jgi:hypothetical protein
MEKAGNNLAMVKLAAADLAKVIEQSGMAAPARAALGGTQDIRLAIGRLLEHGFVMEAARCFAHALPKREAVWWAAMCASHTAPPGLGEADRMAREAAESWVRQQTDETRRQAMAHAERAGFQSPEAWVGVAAFWSGPTIGDADALPVPPAPNLPGLAVAGAVALASVRDRPADRAERLARFIGSARDIADGGSGRLPPETKEFGQRHAEAG